MPLAPPSRCTDPGCNEIALYRGRCGEHRRVGWTEGAPRSTRDRLGISASEWERIRQRIFRRDDFSCQVCRAPAVEVDHIIPVAEGGARTDESNLRAICGPCHDKKSKAEAARGARRARAARKAAAERAALPPPF